MLKVSIVGFGNIGSCVKDVVTSTADMKLVSIVSAHYHSEITVKSLSEISKFGKPDVAIVCGGSVDCPDLVRQLLAMGINAVDSFDIHSKIWDYCSDADKIAKKHGTRAIISAGWDPGSDSVLRALFLAMLPEGETYTNFGPGMSMGHSVAARKIEGIADAVSITLPLGKGIHGRHVYVIIKNGYDEKTVAESIKKADYFCHDETEVTFVSDLSQYKNTNHGVNLVREKLVFDMRIDNPVQTAHILTAAARAVVKQQPGCYTLIDIPAIDFLPGNREELIKKLV